MPMAVEVYILRESIWTKLLFVGAVVRIIFGQCNVHGQQAIVTYNVQGHQAIATVGSIICSLSVSASQAR